MYSNFNFFKQEEEKEEIMIKICFFMKLNIFFKYLIKNYAHTDFIFN